MLSSKTAVKVLHKRKANYAKCLQRGHRQTSAGCSDRGWIRVTWIADASSDFWLDLTGPLSLTQRQAFIVGRKKNRCKSGKSLLTSSNHPLVTLQIQKQPALRQIDVPLHTHSPVKHQLRTKTHSPCFYPKVKISNTSGEAWRRISNSQ